MLCLRNFLANSWVVFMPINRFYLMMELVLVGLLAYLSYQIFHPFFTAIAWALVFGVVFYPAYLFILKYIRVKAMASLLTLLLMLIAIIGPFSYVSFALISEVTDIIEKTGAGDSGIVKKLFSDERISGLVERLQPYIEMKGTSIQEIILESARKFGKSALEKLSTGFTDLLGVTANFVIMLFTAFFFLKDAPAFLQKARDYLPFSEEHKDRLEKQVRDMIVSTIYGGVIVAITQGILGGLAFTILGIGAPVLWGSVMALVSFIPLAGTALVWVPASLMLLVQGSYAEGIILILIGIFVISMVDNILKPLIIGGRTKMPTLIIFFTVLGGIKFFGLLGLVMGPLVVALFLSVFEIFRTIETETKT